MNDLDWCLPLSRDALQIQAVPTSVADTLRDTTTPVNGQFSGDTTLHELANAFAALPVPERVVKRIWCGRRAFYTLFRCASALTEEWSAKPLVTVIHPHWTYYAHGVPIELIMHASPDWLVFEYVPTNDEQVAMESWLRSCMASIFSTP